MGAELANAGVDVNKTRDAFGQLQQLNAKYGELATDAGLAAGGALPPPFGTAADVASLGRSLWKGDWGGALFDVVGFVPLIGDAAKGAKVANRLNDLRKSLDVAKAGVQKSLNQTKQAASKYWDDIAKKNKKAYDDEVAKCADKACKEAAAKLKGDQYKSLPYSDKGKGEWIGERGDGMWVPAEGTPTRAALDKAGVKGIEYKNGFPDYSSVSAGSVDIPMRGNRSWKQDGTGDFANAEAAWKEQGKSLPAGYDQNKWTWHHKEDGVTMELVPTDLHGVGKTPHTGGAAMYQGGHQGGF